MRHVYSRGLYYRPFIESPIALISLWMILGLSLYMLMRLRKRAIGIMFFACLLSICYYANFSKVLMAYPYFLIVILGCWVIEFIKIKMKKA